MNRVFLTIPLLIATLGPSVPSQEAPGRVPLTYERSQTAGALYRAVLKGTAKWAPDGRHLVGEGGKWFEAETGKEAEAAPGKPAEPVRPDPKDRAKDALAAARGGDVPAAALGSRTNASTLPRAADKESGWVEAPDGSLGAAFLDGELWVVPADGPARMLARDAKGWRRVDVAPKGRHIAFVRAFNLEIIDTASGAIVPLSRDGGENLFYGELDWVYQEEVYGRFDFQGAWWSPDGGHLAFLRIDEGAVHEYTVVDHIPYRLEIERLKYPKAGDPNPVATLHVARAADGRTVALDLSKYPPEDGILIVRVAWSPSGDRVIFQVQDREQTWLDLNAADPATGRVTTLFRETSRAWVNVLAQPRWLADGGFLWESERTGYKHVYRYAADGTLHGAVTAGEWQVKDVVLVDEKRREIVFTGSRDGAVDSNTYRVGFDGKGLVRLTPGPGSHRVEFNHDRSLHLDTVSSLSDPGEQRLCRADGTVVRVIAKAALPDAAEKHGMSVPEIVSIPARDGYRLDAAVVKPFAWDGAGNGRTWPIWINTYSGPDAPTVSNVWRGDAFAQFLAQEGILGLQVNVRSASGRGQHHTDACYRQFGVQELKDLEDAVAWVVKNRAGDPDRVGITGWSYGGFMTAYALTHSRAFRLGIAGAGVYDWRDYDTIYTERFMRTPQNNADGYKVSSCVEAASDLHGHLLIVHGTTDDNVHVQNAMQFIYALQKAGKHFDLMLYPRSRHGIGDPRQARHLRDLTWRTIREHLLPPAGAEVPAGAGR